MKEIWFNLNLIAQETRHLKAFQRWLKMDVDMRPFRAGDTELLEQIAKSEGKIALLRAELIAAGMSETDIEAYLVLSP